MKVDVLSEEPLIFSAGSECIDPKLGINLYGPSSWDGITEKEIISGIIGTNSSIGQFLMMIEKLRQRTNISGEPKPWKREFPGLGPKSPLHFDIVIGKDMRELILEEEEEKALSVSSRKQRILNVCKLYEDKFTNLMSTVHPAPEIIYVPLSNNLIERTKDPYFETDRISYERRTMQAKVYKGEIPLFDFHHFLKVVGFKWNVTTQLVKPSTYEMTGSGQQDLATSFWNFSVATYYKATGTPWKLANLDEDTCYVGIAFYQDPSEEESNMRTSMAHVYLKSGESQIIRGMGFRWEKRQGREPHLDSDQAKVILSKVINLFESQKRRKPLRVVVHKSSDYKEGEIEGFTKAADSIENLDLIHIYQRSDKRFFYNDSPYPPLRGTLIQSKKSPAFLYTTGFIPALGTYPGSSLPRPLEFGWAKKSSSVELLAKDILALTRLDWNNCDYCKSQPVTISVSHKVGEILAESSSKKIDPPASYSYYM
jgi:hypothetical protein